MVIYMRDRFYIYFVTICTFMISIILLIICFNYKIKCYETINMIYIGNNKYNLLVEDPFYKIVNHNKSIFIDDKRYDYKIIEYKHVELKNKKYHDLIISIKKDNYKENDIVIGSIISKRVRIIDVFVDSVFS